MKYLIKLIDIPELLSINTIGDYLFEDPYLDDAEIQGITHNPMSIHISIKGTDEIIKYISISHTYPFQIPCIQKYRVTNNVYINSDRIYKFVSSQTDPNILILPDFRKIKMNSDSQILESPLHSVI